jgi:hypothetical protein
MASEGGTSPAVSTTTGYVTDTGWIEKAIALVDHGDIDNRVVKASAAAELAALRADHEAHARQIAALRETLEHSASYMVTARIDRPVREGGEVLGHWQTEDWLIGLQELAEECATIARKDDDASLPPSSMRLVPVERLKEIEFTDGTCPACGGWVSATRHAPDYWLAAALKETA